MGSEVSQGLMNKLLLGILIISVGHSLVWWQIQGMLLSKWWADHPGIGAILIGTPVAYLFITGSKHIIEYYDGQVWPNRLIGFSVGIFFFSMLTWIFLKEPLTPKTMVSLALAASIISIQIWG